MSNKQTREINALMRNSQQLTRALNYERGIQQRALELLEQGRHSEARDMLRVTLQQVGLIHEPAES